MREDQPSFYAIIPASVRYDKSLEPNAKLLYGEITALAQATGECFARNEYFAEVYGVSPRVIMKWLSSLEDAGHIERVYNESKTKRAIYPLDKKERIPPKNWGEEMFTLGGKNIHPRGEKKFTHNNTSINKIKKGTIVPQETPSVSVSEKAPAPKAEKQKRVQKPFVPPTVEEVAAYYAERTGDNLAERGEAFARHFIGYYEAGEWCDQKGNPVRNWKQKILSTWDPVEWLNKHRNNYKTRLPQTAAQAGPLSREEAQAKRRAELNSYTINDLLQ